MKESQVNNIDSLLESTVNKLVEKKFNALQSALATQKPFLTISEAAAYLQISKNTLYSYNNRQLLPLHKTGKKVYYDLPDSTGS